MTDYTNIDIAIVAAIADGNRKFSEILDAVSPLVLAILGRGCDDYRVVDRRVQALRKSGRITWVGGRWSVTP